MSKFWKKAIFDLHYIIVCFFIPTEANPMHTVLTSVKAALAYKPHPDFEHPIKKKMKGKKEKKMKGEKKEKEWDRGAAAVLLNLRRYEV